MEGIPTQLRGSRRTLTDRAWTGLPRGIPLHVLSIQVVLTRRRSLSRLININKKRFFKSSADLTPFTCMKVTGKCQIDS